MNFASDQNKGAPALSAKSHRVLGLRAQVFAEWEERVRRQVKGAALILQPILINTLPVFYDNLAESLTPDYPRALATSNSSVAAAHGGERARMTGYGADQVIHEYQLFRETLIAVADSAGVRFDAADLAVIHASIDTAVRESVQHFVQMQDGFRQKVAASLTHDMRTPLSIISTAAQLLALSSASDKQKDMARKIGANVRRLDEMTRDLLDVLSFHKGQKLPLSLEQFDMLELASSVAAGVNAGGEAQCTLAGAPVTGWWCRNSMRRALENLVGNAVKYGADQPVAIQVGEMSGRLMVSVHNAGRPIPPEQSQRIFAYLRRDNEGASNGWGIGLPFVQNVAESHGGSVALDSSAAGGTTFLMDVPVDCRPFV